MSGLNPKAITEREAQEQFYENALLALTRSRKTLESLKFALGWLRKDDDRKLKGIVTKYGANGNTSSRLEIAIRGEEVTIKRLKAILKTYPDYCPRDADFKK